MIYTTTGGSRELRAALRDSGWHTWVVLRPGNPAGSTIGAIPGLGALMCRSCMAPILVRQGYQDHDFINGRTRFRSECLGCRQMMDAIYSDYARMELGPGLRRHALGQLGVAEYMGGS